MSNGESQSQPRAWRQLVRRSWELWLLLLGHLFAVLFLHNLTGELSEVPDPLVRSVAVAVERLVGVSHQHRSVQIAVLGAITTMLLLAARGRSLRRLCDVLGALLSVRCAMQFLLMNLLLVAPMGSGGLLLRQLVLFLPLVTLNFGWLYWRFDSGARRAGRCHIRFDDDSTHPFDYFHAAANALLQFDPSGARALTRPMKALFVLHGLVMMDLVALTLSRAIALAGSR